MDTDARRLLRNFLIEFVVYAILVGIYFVVVLRTIGDWPPELYYENLTLNAFGALALIVTQAVVLEMVTTFLIERLALERLE